MQKKYDHKEVEKNKYKIWLEKDYFKSGDLSKEPFCIVIPPPNVTGKLHLGHAWDTSIQDIIIRYKRMQGFDTLWLPGMDHAAIATEAKVVAKLKKEGINKYELGREGFLKKAWEWKEKYAENIRKQWAKLGLSLDYSKERFTLDEGLNEAVETVFIKLYEEGLIYRGEKIINWDPEAKTALSNEEVIYKEIKGAFYHIKYYLEDENNYLEVATTRPETLLGDTAVAVNKDDERYKKYIGKNVILPLLNKKIPVISDEHADPEFGTGVVKITPAHDPNDFEVGNRHNLERINILNPDGTMNEKTGKYQGLDRIKAREEIVNDLKEENLLIKIEEITHNVGHSERTGALVEPYLSKQWFVKMRPLADKVLENQKNKDKKVNFVPKQYEKTMNHWMEITYDWCISRQLWWGHRIPAWYKEDEIYVGKEKPKGEGWKQDEDVLDTWFSSALWPFSTLGWPKNTKDLERYYPNNVLVTGYDIIPFWVNRMAFQGLHFTNQRPFKDCLIHGLIRDNQGRKMSKSLGNGVDPMDVIEKYGTDSLRCFLTTNTAPGMDLRYDEEKIKKAWNFINKLWNASRFVLMNLENFQKEDQTHENISELDKWILTKHNKTIKEVTENMEKYEFNNAGNTLYKHIWEDFCDNFIELSKNTLPKNTTKTVLLEVLTNILKMLHPFMPYVTEEIYQKLPFHQESIMISKYPTYDKNKIFNQEEELIDKIIEDITNIRNLKVVNKITKEAKVKINSKYKDIYTFALKIKENTPSQEENTKSYNYKSNIIDITFYQKGEEINKDLLTKEIETLNQSIQKRQKLLSNENYTNKAPKNIVEQERKKLQEEQEKIKYLEKQI